MLIDDVVLVKALQFIFDDVRSWDTRVAPFLRALILLLFRLVYICCHEFNAALTWIMHLGSLQED